MNHRILGAGLGAAAALALAAPAQAQTVAPKQTTYYMKCATPSKVQNANGPAGMVASWSTVKPTASFQSGAGCGFADAPVGSTAPTDPYDGYFGGGHGDAIAKAEIEAHSLLLSRARAADTNSVRVRIFVNGAEAFNEVRTVKPTTSTTGATEMFKFVVDGLKIPAGAADRKIFIVLGSTTAQGAANAWVGDASEIPTSVTFTEPLPPAPTT